MKEYVKESVNDATHIGTMRFCRRQIFMKRGKRGQWVVWVDTKHGGRWEGINYLTADMNPVKIAKPVPEESNQW